MDLVSTIRRALCEYNFQQNDPYAGLLQAMKESGWPDAEILPCEGVVKGLSVPKSVVVDANLGSDDYTMYFFIDGPMWVSVATPHYDAEYFTPEIQSIALVTHSSEMVADRINEFIQDSVEEDEDY